MAYSALRPATVERFVPLAAARGVSAVARGPGGFLPAFRAAGGRLSGLGLRQRDKRPWVDIREDFIKRHMAQARRQGRPLYETQGKWAGSPTRWHLALIMWAYSPDAGRLGQARADVPR